MPDRIKSDTLSSRENDYFSSYSNFLSEYSDDVGCDLLSDMEVGLSQLIDHHQDVVLNLFFCNVRLT